VKRHHNNGISCLLTALAVGLSPAMAAKKPEAPVAAPLNEAGNKLEAKYATTLKSLQQDLATALPKAQYAGTPGTHMSSITQPEFGEAIANFLRT